VLLACCLKERAPAVLSPAKSARREFLVGTLLGSSQALELEMENLVVGDE
jgi:hypothetical protein